jgi:hypothetical protein
MFAECDADGSGSLSAPEFLGVLERLHLPLDGRERDQLVQVTGTLTTL